jgi:hypothetical protein
MPPPELTPVGASPDHSRRWRLLAAPRRKHWAYVLEVFLGGFQPACGTSPGVRPSLLDDLRSSLAIVMNDPG